MTPATARSHTRRTAQTRPLPRRVSGPVRRPVAVPGGATAVPRRGSTSIFTRVRALPEHRVVDRLLRSRLWIWALGVMLGGIVAMQVSLLKLNSGISRAVETSATLEHQNGNLETKIASLSATDHVQQGAIQLGMIMPAAGDVGYLSPRPDDSTRAVRAMQPPSSAAAALLANNGIMPGSLAATVPATTTTTTPPPATATAAPPATGTPTTTPTTPQPGATTASAGTSGTVPGQG